MKRNILLTLFVGFFCDVSHGQKIGKDEINYSDPIQIDSSAYFIIPKIVDNDDKVAYGKGKGFLPWNNYRDLYFYNASENITKKLFSNQLVLILPFNSRRYYYEKADDFTSNILANHIVYLARTEDFSGDKGLDTDDPVYLYLSTKKGDNLTQITPKGMNVISWIVSKDKKIIFVRLQQDKNANKKFGEGDDEVYYRIDLNDDISKVKCYQITLQ